MKRIKSENIVKESEDVSFTGFVINQQIEYGFDTDLTELDTTTTLGERRLSRLD